MTMPVPQAIDRFVGATNAGDNGAFLEAFAEDAFLSDWGRDFHGRGEIARWNQTDNIGVRSHLRVVAIEAVAGTYRVRMAVRGGGFNGEGVMTFTLTGDVITRLVIS